MRTFDNKKQKWDKDTGKGVGRKQGKMVKMICRFLENFYIQSGLLTDTMTTTTCNDYDY